MIAIFVYATSPVDLPLTLQQLPETGTCPGWDLTKSRVESTMNAKYDVIDTFSRRPVLSALALDELRTSLETLLPGARINPEIAVVTEAADAAAPATETLFWCTAGEFRRWQNITFQQRAHPSGGRSVCVDAGDVRYRCRTTGHLD